MIRGEYEGRHGMIIGHFPGFNLTAHLSTVINVKVLLATGEVEKVCQDYLRLADFHRELPFGIPKPVAKVIEDSTGWGKIPMKRARNWK